MRRTLSRGLRIVFCALFLLGAVSAGRILDRMESSLRHPSDPEPLVAARHALLSQAVGPVRGVFLLFASGAIVLPPLLSWMGRRRVFERSHPRADRLFLAAALAMGLGSAVFLNQAVLDGCRITPDERTYVNQARIFAQGELWAQGPPVPEFFEEPYMVFHDGRAFSIFQPGWSLLLVPGVLCGHEEWVPPLLACFCLAVVFFLGRTLYGAPVAKGAVLVLLCSPSFLFHSATYYAHPAGLFWVTLSTWAFVVARTQVRAWAYVACGASLGAAFLTRYFDLFFGLPFGLWLLWDVLRRKKHALRNLAFFVLPLFGALAVAVAYQWALTGDPFLSPHELYIEHARYLYVLEGRTEPHRLYGFDSDYSLRMGLARMASRWASLNLWLFPLALLALLPVVVRGNLWDRTLLAGALCLSLVYVPYVPPGGWQYGPRYYFPAFGVVALLVARGLAMLFEKLGSRPAGSPWGLGVLRGWLGVSVLFNLALCVFMGFGLALVVRGLRDGDRLLSERGIRKGVVLLTLHTGFYDHADQRIRTRQQRLERDLPFYLIHNEADYGRPLLLAHTLGPEEDRRLMLHFPDRPFYLLKANPYAAALGLGRADLERISTDPLGSGFAADTDPAALPPAAPSRADGSGSDGKGGSGQGPP